MRPARAPLAPALALAAVASALEPRPVPPSATVVAGDTRRLEREHVVRVGTLAPFYSPALVRARVGDSVRWVNPALADRHGVRDVARGAFSFEIAPGGEAAFRFKEPGEYAYRCRFHPWMAGRVVVEPRRLEVAWLDLPASFAAASLSALPRGGVRVAGDAADERAFTVDETGVAPSPPDAPRATGGGSLDDGDGGTWRAAEGPALLHVQRDGRRVAFPVPPAGGRVVGLAVAGAATAWALTNTNELVRVGAEGADVFEPFPAPERGAALAFDVHGGLWLLDAARHRVGRVALGGLATAAAGEAAARGE